MITLPAINLSRYRFTLVVEEPMELPPYKGSALRGGFGHAFKSIVCYQKAVRHCDGCLLRYTCPYAYIFETPVPPDAEVLSKNDRVPLPMVIEPPLDRKRSYAPGDLLVFHLTLVGGAQSYLPYFLVAFQQLGRHGLGRHVETDRGRRRGRYRLDSVVAEDPLSTATEPVYDAASPSRIRACALTADRAAVQAYADTLASERLTIGFRTPTRLRHAQQLVRDGPPFDALVKALLGRVSSLSYFHCGERWETDFRGWIDRAAQVEAVAVETGWADWERYSGRQQQRIKMGGLVGRVTYAGDLAPYRSLLALGSLIHVGKGTVFGNGWLHL